MTKQAQAAATTARVAVFLASQLREVAQTRIVQSFGAHARGQGPGPSEDDLKTFAKLVAQEHRLHKGHAAQPAALQQTPVGTAQTSHADAQSVQLASQADPHGDMPAPAAAKARSLHADGKQGLSRVAYASLIDLTRMSFGQSAPAECCDACSTVNLGSALICKGCNGKLPAYYANHYAEPAQADDRSASAASAGPDEQRRDPAASSHATGAHRSRLLAPLAAIAIAFLASFVMLVSGLRGGVPESAQQMARSLTPLMQQTLGNSAVVSLVSASPLEAYGSSVPSDAAVGPAANAETASLQESLSASESSVDAAAPVRRMRASMNAPVQRTNLSPSVGSRSGLRAQLARCDSLNFFSRAICMNNLCSPQAAATSAECSSVTRQRRIDEARRNPVLMG